MTKAGRLVVVIATTAVLVTLIVLYVLGFLRSRPPAVAVPVAPTRTVHLTLQTVAAVGPALGGRHPDWVSYLVKNQQGQWIHSTMWNLPAHALVQVTVLQYDGASGLRNPFWAKPQGVVGGSMGVNGKRLSVLNPAVASHTFAIPYLGPGEPLISVPLMGIADNAKNQCSAAPCTLGQAHNTITFSFRTGAPGLYRWQCMVPCAAGFYFGFGGPMQTIGFMDGFLNVH